MPLRASDAPSFSSKCLAPTVPSMVSPAPYFPQLSATFTRKKNAAQHNCVSGWLEMMRAGSPPRSKEPKDHLIKEQKPDSTYFAWIEKHPSALSMFEEIVAASKGKQVALFLDYDGTLSPIVENPDAAFLSAEMRDAVKQVAAQIPTAIITGRSRDKVFEFVQLPELYYAGSHGMDIIGPAEGCHGFQVSGMRSLDKEGRQVMSFQPANDFLPTMNEVLKALEKCVKHIEGARIEDNKFCISVHYRQVQEEDWQVLAEEVYRVLKKYPRLFLTHGRKVLEIRPSIKWDKGKAVEFLLNALGFEDSRDVVPIYIGDDRTDEDAFNMLNDKFKGYGILVSSVPKATSATFSVRDTSEVEEFLKRLNVEL